MTHGEAVPFSEGSADPGEVHPTHRDESISVRTLSEPAAPASKRPDTPRARGAVVGVLTALFALGIAEVVASFIDDQSSPLVAVGSAMIDATPEWLKSFAIRTFGVNDKRALIVGMIVVILILAAVLGIASIRRPRIGLTGLWVLAAVGAIAAFKRPTGSVLSVVPSIVGAFAGSYALTWLLKAAQPSVVRGEEGPLETPGELDRRRFLLASLTIGGAAVVAGGLGRFISSRRFGVAEAARDALTIPAPTDVAPPPPAGFDTTGLSPFITPNADFYRVDTALVVPRVDTDGWRLTIHGMVDHEMELTLDDLMARDLIERDITLTCVSNEVGGPYIGNARWVGAPLKPLLEEAGVHPGADQIVSRSVDGFTVGTPTSVAMDGRDAMLAVSMNGEVAAVHPRVPRPHDRARVVRLRVGDEMDHRHRAHDVRCVRRLLGAARLGAAGGDQDGVPDRHPAIEREGRHGDGGRRRVGSAPRHRTGRGSRGRRRVERRDPFRAGHDRHVASVAMAVAGDRGEPHAPGPRDRCGR